MLSFAIFGVINLLGYQLVNNISIVENLNPSLKSFIRFFDSPKNDPKSLLLKEQDKNYISDYCLNNV